MPQILALVLAGAGIYAGLKWLKSTADRARAADARAREAAERQGAKGAQPAETLELDPKSGVYKPRGK